MNPEQLYSNRINLLPPYLFVEVDRLKQQLKAAGKDIIDLGIGDPDIPSPEPVIAELAKASRDPENHRYPSSTGLSVFRRQSAEWFKKRFGVTLDADSEILPVLGSKEAIGHIPLAFVNPGDVVLIPNPGYPVYKSGTIFAGGIPYEMPLLEENAYLPDFSIIPQHVLKTAKMMFINYPNNPTGAVATKDFFRKAVEFCTRHGIILCQDAAYSEMAKSEDAPSLLEIDGAKEIGIEFHSHSKSYNMTGWRVGFAAGNAKILAGLSKIKSNLDSGVFNAVQHAGMAAYALGDAFKKKNNAVYDERRDALVDGLNAIGWKTPKAKATFYVWIPVPPGYTSKEMSMLLLEKASIVCTPGNGFGEYGEGYIRMALTVPKERLQEAVRRIKDIHI